MPKHVPVWGFVNIAGDRTLSLSDAGKIIVITSEGARTVTIPTNASVPFPIGTEIKITGTDGSRLISPASGVSLLPYETPGQYFNWEVATIIKRGTNSWFAYGAIYGSS